MERVNASVLCRIIPSHADSGEDLKKCDPKKSSEGLIPTTLTAEKKCCATLIGDKYLVLDVPQGATINKCINVQTQEKLVCKVVNREDAALLPAHYRMASHPHVNSLREVLLGDRLLYLIFPPSYGDLHTHVRNSKPIGETFARKLFRQMVSTVKACHEKGIVLRDLKLRKFVFSDPQKTQIKIETLEDAIVLQNPSDDMLHDKRGCPVYVSPEIIKSHMPYSGRAADMWSLGVVLYTMLLGRYPFNDNDHAGLFLKISRGEFSIPDSVSNKAKCLIRSLLKQEPRERIRAEDVMLHPWLAHDMERRCAQRSDQVVPDIDSS